MSGNEIADRMVLDALRESIEINHPEIARKLKDFLFIEFLKDTLNGPGFDKRARDLLFSLYLG